MACGSSGAWIPTTSSPGRRWSYARPGSTGSGARRGRRDFAQQVRPVGRTGGRAGMEVLADRIQHVIVLMLENRSFDCLLGRLYPSSDSFHGLTGSESNLDPAGARVGVWNSPASDPQTMRIPAPDPGELFTDINTQIFGTPAPADTTPATMAGFASSYVAQAPAGTSADTYDPRAVMHFFTSAQVPVISQLASAFAICDQWHASAPCQTWPNRFFVHTGTAAGYENNSPVHFPYRMPTVFSRFDAGMSDAWRIYFHDVPQS